MAAMTDFLRQLWGFVRPYRGRFFLGLLCGTGYGFVNGLLLGVVKLVTGLVFDGSTDFHGQLAKHLEKLPQFLHPLAGGLAAVVPEISGPTTQLGWVLVASAIPAVMVVRNTLAYLVIYLT